ncbi:MAG: LlaJI family restriction endonuclease [Bacilli bacterium]
MIKMCSYDGAIYDASLVSSNGFLINVSRDIKTELISDSFTGEETDKSKSVYNFVGFTSNEQNDLFFVFPKHFRIGKVEYDARLTFGCIAKHLQKRPDLYIGENSNKMFDSNYPFAAFYEVYNYYTSYGLYVEERTFIKPNAGGRISWKDTISRCNKYLVGDNVNLFPIYYKRDYHFTNFITECMIYVIDYTINKFGFLIGLELTGEKFPEMNMFEEKQYVISVLQYLRQQTFKDREQILIDNIIKFFVKINIGGNFYLKHYAFSSVWEDMVTYYLSSYYKGINSNNEIVFDKLTSNHVSFAKKPFHTNAASPAQYISPDHYGIDNSNQLIFDAKYYMDITGMDYKQIAYVFMLKEIRDSLSSPKKFLKTYSALILPSEYRNTKMHFVMEPLFGKTSADVIITEEYIDIVDVMETYCNEYKR